MKLHELHPSKESHKTRHRVGRGPGSGSGKTSGRGQKGQKAREGSSTRPGFEGGQTPLMKRLPKYGFKNPTRKEYATVNIEKLNRFEKGTEITPELLLETRVIRNEKSGVKILGNGELNVALTVKAHKFSGSAKEAIEAAGGNAEVV